MHSPLQSSGDPAASLGDLPRVDETSLWPLQDGQHPDPATNPNISQGRGPPRSSSACRLNIVSSTPWFPLETSAWVLRQSPLGFISPAPPHRTPLLSMSPHLLPESLAFPPTCQDAVHRILSTLQTPEVQQRQQDGSVVPPTECGSGLCFADERNNIKWCHFMGSRR